MRLLDKVAVITSGSRGSGFATADKFLTEGAKVIITASTRVPRWPALHWTCPARNPTKPLILPVWCSV